jgi:hypothetical protein
MSILGVSWKRLTQALIVAASATITMLPARAQTLPPTPPQGAWGEVIMANRRWMVVQNHLGQQFPIDAEFVSQFLIRWPTQLSALTGQSLVEAIGPDHGSNMMTTDHIDVFEGADRDLVQPTSTRLLPNNRPDTAVDPGFNRFMNAFDIGSQNLMYGWAYPVAPGTDGIPARLHVVGSVLQINPLEVSMPGNNFATIAPAGAMTITRVTRGTFAYAEKGDLIFLMPTGMTPRTVVLSQAVLYKKFPMNQTRLP